MINKIDSNNELKINDELNIKHLIFPYIIHWKWILISIFISLSIAFIYLRYSTPTYGVVAKVLIKDEDKGNIPSEMSAFKDLSSMMGGTKNNIENEIEIFKSRSLISKVVKDLKLNISYFDISGITKKELFEETNYKLYILNGDSSVYFKNGVFQILPKSQNNFEFIDYLTLNKLDKYNCISIIV